MFCQPAVHSVLNKCYMAVLELEQKKFTWFCTEHNELLLIYAITLDFVFELSMTWTLQQVARPQASRKSQNNDLSQSSLCLRL